MISTTKTQNNISWTIRIPRASVRTKVNDQFYLEPEAIITELDLFMKRAIEESDKDIISYFTELVDNNYPDLAFSMNSSYEAHFFIFVVAW